MDFCGLHASPIVNHAPRSDPTLIHKKGLSSGNSMFSMKLTRQWGEYLLFSYFPQKGICDDGGSGGAGGEFCWGSFS